MPSFLNRQSQWPSVSQWAKLHQVLSPREKIILPGLIFVFVISLFTLVNGIYVSNTTLAPAKGGALVEGIIGSARFLNPVYADTNDVDRGLIQLIYSGILQYDNEGNLIPDLAAEEPEIDLEGKTITVSLKENVLWHDGTPFTADDVIFTVATIQDPAYNSPIRANWIGVSVEKVTDHRVRFHLLDPYAPFLERLTLKILPAHIWENVPAESFALTPLNLQPTGTGPYRLTKVTQGRSGFVEEIQLKSYSEYHNREAYIESLTFRFFSDEKDLIAEANRGTIQSFSLAQIKNVEGMKNPAFTSYSFSMPRYFALFFNLDAPTGQDVLEEKTIREALILATNKNQLLQSTLRNQARSINSPFLPEIFNIQHPSEEKGYNPEQALSLLEEEGYVKEQGKIGKPQLSGNALTRDLVQGANGEEVTKLQQCLAQDPDVYPDGTVNGNFGPLTKQAVIRFQEKYADEVLTPIGLSAGTGKAGVLTREKLNALCFSGTGQNEPLTVTIATIDQSPLSDVAKALEQQWESFGIEVEVQTFSATALERDVIKPRAYQALLFGEVLGKIPDPFPFWHSTQTKAPGLNLSSYSDKTVDKLLEDARRELDTEKRVEMFSDMQEIVLSDSPALFLYDLDYHYFVTKEVQNIQTPVITDPSQRFAGITDWFIKTKRAKK